MVLPIALRKVFENGSEIDRMVFEISMGMLKWMDLARNA
jgi:hypothetical protein